MPTNNSNRTNNVGPKVPADSLTEISFIAKPSDANSIGTVFGGRILERMDETAAICARRHSNVRVSTVAVDQVEFYRTLKVGHVVRLVARLTRSFRTSMEMKIDVFGQDTYAGEEFLAASAYFVIVGLDENGQPTAVPELKPQTETERALWEEAGVRRENRKQRRKRNP